MAVEIEVEKLEGMTQAELEKLEDETVAADGENPDDVAPASQATPKAADPAKDAEPAAGEVDKGGEAQSPKTEAGIDPAAAPTADDDIAKHVSPPSKWAEERRAKRELSTRVEEAETKAAKTDVLQKELDDLKGELDWMKTAIQSKGVTLPETPLEVFNPEKITEIRDEYGDEIADMFQATAAILAKQAVGAVSSPAPAADPAPADPPAPAAASPAPAAAPAEPTADPALLKAIDDNDELSYWQENSAPLWAKAIAKDNEMLKDPAYASLPYAERFAKVVETVKTDVTNSADVNLNASDPNKPPESLSDSGGIAPTPIANDALEKILAADDPNVQMKLYNALPQNQKDEVDKALNI
jgi:hypothetical protein